LWTWCDQALGSRDRDAAVQRAGPVARKGVVMRPFTHGGPPARQRGWVGLVVVLLALVIVAWLAKDALKQYGLVPGAAVATKAGTAGERARAPGATGIEAFDPGAAAAAPATALDRARGVEDMVRQQADERARRDGALK